ESLGALKRDDVADLVRGMGQAERHPLRKMGVQFGETHILLPKLLKPKPTQLKTLLWAVHEGREPQAPPTPGLTSLPILEWRDDRWWLAAGFLRAGRHAFRLDVVQRIAEGARQAEQASRKPKQQKAADAAKPEETAKPDEKPAVPQDAE